MDVGFEIVSNVINTLKILLAIIQEALLLTFAKIEESPPAASIIALDGCALMNMIQLRP